MITILQGDVVDQLRTLPDQSVHCVVTSPPYWGLRDYQTEGQIGLEKTPEEYVGKMVGVFREVRRVLRDDGTVWLNLGDCYSGSNSTKDAAINPESISFKSGQTRGGISKAKGIVKGLKPKDLVMMPARVAMALQADGWWLRSQIPWLKRNAMPESCTDRPSSAIEYVFLLTKKANCYYDADAIRVKYSEAYLTENRPMGVLRQRLYPDSKYLTEEYGSNQFKPKKELKQDLTGNPTYTGFNDRWKAKNLQRDDPNTMHKARAMARNGTNIPGHSGNYNADGECILNPSGRNRRNSDWFFESWQGLYSEGNDPLAMIVNPQPFAGSHFAVFPEAFVEPCIKAGTSERGCCPVCGAPWERIVEKGELIAGKGAGRLQGYTGYLNDVPEENYSGANFRKSGYAPGYSFENKTTGWQPSCKCGREDTVPCTVCDPFMGSGTTLKVARDLKRDGIGIELNPEYVKIARERLRLNEQLVI